MRIKSLVLAAGAAALLAACGGGGGGGGTTAVSLTGTAAIGAPLSGATVTLRGANGQQLTVTANEGGQFTFADVSGLTAPAMLQAVGIAGGQQRTLFSVAPSLPTTPGSSAVTNVTPITNAVLTKALGTTPSLTTVPNTAQLANLDLALTRLSQALAQVFMDLGLPANTNPLTTPFQANGRGLDQLLDLLAFNAVGNTLEITDKSTGATDVVALTGNVPSVPTPSAAGLDTSGIATLVANFNAWSTPNLSSSTWTQFAGLWDVDFLDNGLKKESIFDFIIDEQETLTIENWALNGCTAATVTDRATCNIIFELVITTDDFVETEFMEWIVARNTNGNWTILGNQFAFDASFTSVFNAANIPLASGFNLSIDKEEGSSAELEVSTDGGNNWQSIAKFTDAGTAPDGQCQNISWLRVDRVISPGNLDCSNFVALTDEDITTFNDAISAGNLRARITLDTGSSEKVIDKPIRTKLLTVAQGKEVSDTLSVTGIGTNAVNFSIRPDLAFELVRVAVTSDNDSGSTEWDGFRDIRNLNGTATVAAANTLCKTNTDSNICDDAYDLSSGRIDSIFLVARDSIGRSFWFFDTYR